jgi:ABC-type oligopeptide transport system ATPase subunit
MNHSETTRKISEITDTGLFERLATAVLRESKPDLYGSLSHTGINPYGKTVKSPVDGFAFVQGEASSCMVGAHHATSSLTELRRKWMHVASPSDRIPDGDLVKFASIVSDERKSAPSRQAHLVLTTNKEPGAELIRETQALADSHEITLDVWSCSRIAHFLDTSPEGQWIRRQFLGIAQERLSSSLLTELSLASLETLPFFARTSEIVPREITNTLKSDSPRPITFLVGESGVGKTTLAYTYLDSYIKSGGFGIIVHHETLEQCHTLTQVIDAELRKLHSALESNAGSIALSLCSPDTPFLVLIEDINSATQPAPLLERLTSWSARPSKDGAIEKPVWHLLCPVWPSTLALTNEETNKRIKGLSLGIDTYLESEALSYINQASVDTSIIEAKALAAALGNDPLLLALYDYSKKSEPNQVIAEFIDSNLARLSQAPGQTFTYTDFKQALLAIAKHMVNRLRMTPTWQEIQEWTKEQPINLSALLHIARDRKILHLIKRENQEYLTFRHDRVRTKIISDCVLSIISEKSSHVALADPYLAEAVGGALIEDRATKEIVQQMADLNPLSLFYALKVIRESSSQLHNAVVETIFKWLDKPETHSPANEHLLWACLSVLAETDSTLVPEITKKFKRLGIPGSYARFRNGDIGGGINLCLQIEPWVSAPWFDHQFQHVIKKYGATVTQKLIEFLKRSDINNYARRGALRFAGRLGDPALSEAIYDCWQSDTDRETHLSDYLWAGARCCGDDAERLLGPVCDAWARLPTEQEGNKEAPRYELTEHNVVWAFRKGISSFAISFFLERAKRDDLRWAIACALRRIDHPDTLEFIVREIAAKEHQYEGKAGFWIFPRTISEEWKRGQEEGRRAMSLESRARLKILWDNTDNEKHLRMRAFSLWSATVSAEDIPLLILREADPVLSDKILAARLERGDRSAISGLIKKIQSSDEPSHDYWWQFGRNIWSDEMITALDQHFERRRNEVTKEWFSSYSGDWMVSENLMRMPPEEAERLLVSHWDHLRYTENFVHTALYLATPKTLQLAQTALSDCQDAPKMLQHISSHFGVMNTAHPGVNRIEVLEGLIPHFDQIGSYCIWHFWLLCNKHNWLDFRRRYLDARLAPSEWNRRCFLDEASCYSELDQRTSHDPGGMKYWLDHYLEQHETLEDIFSMLFQWLYSRKSIAAFKLVAEALIHAGRRSDLQLFRIDDIEPKSQVSEIMQDVRFSVFRRSAI